ncbi:uncharacterized protein LOC128265323 [Drosophila gunungcola]|uniref:uncharacterized protein LOC128265323 n=1 Tax=Drosophila gunungcola TaxID=103775 RepID=UPI0022DED8D7|nr:uncharacterized protein LOC128265323 [Drosophila gunungcola]
MLGVASDFLKRSFMPGLEGTETGELHLENVSADTFKKFRTYVYTYNKETLAGCNNESIVKLMECAHMWMIPSLRKACEEIAVSRINQMVLSDLLIYFDSALKNWCSSQIIIDEVYQLESNAFREFVTRIKGSISERVIFDLVEKYVIMQRLFTQNLSEHKKLECHGIASKDKSSEIEQDANANPHPFPVEKLSLTESSSFKSLSKKDINEEYVKSLISLITFTDMTHSEFFEGPGKSDLINMDDKFQFMYKIACSNNQVRIGRSGRISFTY